MGALGVLVDCIDRFGRSFEMSFFSAQLGAFSNLLGTVVLQKPGAFPWEVLIVSVFDFVKIYGWRIILFTLLLRLLLSPMDFFSRFSMRKNARKLEGVKDKLEAVEKRFTDPLEKMRAQNAIKKEAGIKQFASCLPMLITPIIFIWMSVSMGNVAKYMNMQNYVEWYNVYQTTYSQAYNTHGEAYQNDSKATEIAQKAVTKYYEDNDTDSFLWVKSIWSSDVPWQTAIKNQNDFKKAIDKYATEKPERFVDRVPQYQIDGAGKFDLDIEGNPIIVDNSGSILEGADFVRDAEGQPIAETDSAGKVVYFEKAWNNARRNEALGRYDKVTADLRASANNSANGYLILVVLASGISFLSFWVMQKQQSASGMNMMGMGGTSPFGDPKNAQGTQKWTMRIMRFMMPAMYIYFGLVNSAMFSIYMIASSLITLGFTTFMTFLINMLEKKKTHDEITKVQQYGRPDPKDLID
ncbi:MAG: YidC/Oxa1 family membrane protein insertase [Firmicutes bacterium]|nr:YidC/Oxa1 family membrane protein insertase [Bacillota bacterium]